MINWGKEKAKTEKPLRFKDLKCGETFRIINDSTFFNNAIRMRLDGSQFCTIRKSNNIRYSYAGQVFDADIGKNKWDLEVEIVNIEANEV